MVERIGIERTWGEVAKADVILHLLDADLGPRAADEAIVATHLYLSANAHQGIDLLRAELLRIAGWQQTGESLYLARERHLIALRNAREHLDFAAAHAAQTDQSLDLFAEELRLAQAQLSSITGQFTPDDLLGVIFSRFCIGK